MRYNDVGNAFLFQHVHAFTAQATTHLAVTPRLACSCRDHLVHLVSTHGHLGVRLVQWLLPDPRRPS